MEANNATRLVDHYRPRSFRCVLLLLLKTMLGDCLDRYAQIYGTLADQHKQCVYDALLGIIGRQ